MKGCRMNIRISIENAIDNVRPQLPKDYLGKEVKQMKQAPKRMMNV